MKRDDDGRLRAPVLLREGDAIELADGTMLTARWRSSLELVLPAGGRVPKFVRADAARAAAEK